MSELHGALLFYSYLSPLAYIISRMITASFPHLPTLVLHFHSRTICEITTANSCNIRSYFLFINQIIYIRESIDSLCRNGSDAQYMQCLTKSLTSNTLKSPLSCEKHVYRDACDFVYLALLLYPPFLVCVLLACHPYTSFHL